MSEAKHNPGEAGAQRCGGCQTKLRPGALQCPGCGRPVQEAEEQDRAPRTSSRIQRRAIRDPTDPWANRTLAGKYRLEGVLGEGSMGRVYAATRLSDGRPMAVKMLHARWADDPVAVRRFEREALAAGKLSHPAVVRVVDFGRASDKGPLYLVMERVDGENLHRWLEHNLPVEPQRIGAILDDVLGALQEAHEAGIVHRDLKSENVIVVEQEDGSVRAKVCDFGIAKLMEPEGGTALTAKGYVCGTPEFMAPEQIRGDPIDARTDVYAVGCLLYHMLTGHLPFRGHTAHETLRRHLKERPVPPRQRAPELPVPEALEQVCLKALAKSPEQRYPSAAAMREAVALAVQRDARSWRQVGRRRPSRAWAWAVGAVLLAGALLLGWWLLR